MTEMSRERREELWAYLDSPFLYNAEPIETSEQDAIDPPTYGELRALLRDSAWRERVEPQVIERTEDMPHWARMWTKHGGVDHEFCMWIGDAGEGTVAPNLMPDTPSPISRAIVDTGDEEGV